MANDGHVKIGTELDKSGLQKGLSGLGGFAQKGFAAVGNAAVTASKVAVKAIGAAGTAISGLGAFVIKVGGDFEAGMSQVEAVSGATAEEMDRLTEKAKEMGAKTKFSASESAEAFNYMAMAGWKTEDMLGGIEGIMNLAAASGESLAMTSDIVTDALTAFGLTASDSSHFADVLAASSSNANTNVAMMGETFKYVAPVAGALGYSAEDTALAIGLMANAGIKASQAGTSLRTALTNMVSPTDDMDTIMSMLEISVTNADGSMKSLDETMGILRDKFKIVTEEQKNQNYAMREAEFIAENGADVFAGYTEEQKRAEMVMAEGRFQLAQLTEAEAKLYAEQLLGIKTTKKQALTEEQRYMLAETLGRQAFEGLTESQQAAYASALFGKEAMSGMLAIINASEEDYEKLSAAIGDCDGAAADMAETMQDNLQGQFTIMKSAAEGLGIALYEELQEPLKDLVKIGTECIAELTEAFNEGGTEGLIEAGGELLGNILIGASQQLPTLVDLSVSMIDSLLLSIQGNLPAIAEAGVSILTSLCGGMLTVIGSFFSLGANVLENIALGLSSNLSGIVEEGNKLISSFTESLTSNLPNVIESGVQIVTSLVTGFAQMLPELLNAAVEGIISLALALTDPNNLTNIIESGITLLTSLVTGLMEAIPKLIEAAPKIIANLVSAIVANLPRLVVAAIEIMRSLAKGMLNAIAELLKTVPEIYKELKEKFKNIDWGSIGKNLIEGIKKGISEKAASLVEGALDAAKSAVNAVKDWLGIASPSKLARDLIGKNLIAGIGVGIEGETPNLVKKSVNSAHKTVESMQGAITEKSGTIAADVGYRLHMDPEGRNTPGETKVVLEKGSITGDVSMDGVKVGELVAPTVDIEIEKVRKESER